MLVLVPLVWGGTLWPPHVYDSGADHGGTPYICLKCLEFQGTSEGRPYICFQNTTPPVGRHGFASRIFR